jgi:hypothetical protein
VDFESKEGKRRKNLSRISLMRRVCTQTDPKKQQTNKQTNWCPGMSTYRATITDMQHFSIWVSSKCSASLHVQLSQNRSPQFLQWCCKHTHTNKLSENDYLVTNVLIIFAPNMVQQITRFVWTIHFRNNANLWTVPTTDVWHKIIHERY